MQTIKLKRGLNIPFEGPAAETLGSVRRPEVFHIVPDHFAGITPKLDVTVSTISPSICHEVMGPDAMILVF